MKTYIAGPMTGIKDFNFPAFHAAEEVLSAKGFEVVNPAKVNTDQSGQIPWEECLRLDIIAFLTAKVTHMHMLPGWQKSRGATLEHHIARSLGLTVVEMETL